MKKFRSVERAIKRGHLKIEIAKTTVKNEAGETILGDAPQLFRKVRNGNQPFGNDKGRWINY